MELSSSPNWIHFMLGGAVRWMIHVGCFLLILLRIKPVDKSKVPRPPKICNFFNTKLANVFKMHVKERGLNNKLSSSLIEHTLSCFFAEVAKRKLSYIKNEINGNLNQGIFLLRFITSFFLIIPLQQFS